MCSVFGFTQYSGVISKRNTNKLVRALAVAGMSRGTDATGYAYNHDGEMTVHKRPLPADHLSYDIPARVRAVLGHTRLTTQGSAMKNRNNHPFSGKVDTGKFAFAHNGVLRNDHVLRPQQGLPNTPIETDSYIFVQLLEKYGRIDFTTLKRSAELTKGMFVYTVLDAQNNLYIVKGDNPLTIYHFRSKRIYVYASTQTMLEDAIPHTHLAGVEYETIQPDEGEILRIGNDGEMTTARFKVDIYSVYHMASSRFHRHNWAYDDLMSSACGYEYGGYGSSLMDQDELAGYMDSDADSDCYDVLLSMASGQGFAPEDVDLMLSCGYDISEIADMLQTDPFQFRICLMEAAGY